MSDGHGYIASTVHARAGETHEHHHHVTSWQTLTLTLLGLLALTVLTVALSKGEQWVAATWAITIPQWVNVAIAMSIATVKAVMVCAIFMHLLSDKPLNAIILLFSLLAFALFLTFTAIDLKAGRGQVYAYEAGEVTPGGTGVMVDRMQPVRDRLTGLPAVRWSDEAEVEPVRAPRLDEATGEVMRDGEGRILTRNLRIGPDGQPARSPDGGFLLDDGTPVPADTPLWRWHGPRVTILTDAGGHQVIDAVTGEPAWDPRAGSVPDERLTMNGPPHLFIRDLYANPLLTYFLENGDPRLAVTHHDENDHAHGHAVPSRAMIEAMLASPEANVYRELDPDLAAEKRTWAKIARFGQMRLREHAEKHPEEVAAMTLTERVAWILEHGEKLYKARTYEKHHGNERATPAETRRARVGLTADDESAH